MYVRLAFAVAAHLEPEILVVDEVLAVGDSGFQKKCVQKMSDVAGHGKTVLVVSHNIATIARLCTRGLLLDRGQIVADDDVGIVAAQYQRGLSVDTGERSWETISTAPGDSVVRLRKIRAVNELGLTGSTFRVTERIGIEIEYEVLQDGVILAPNLHFYDANGLCLFVSLDTDKAWHNCPRSRGLYRSTVWCPANYFNESSLVLNAAITQLKTMVVHVHEREVLALTLTDVLDNPHTRGDYHGAMPGVIRPHLSWQTEEVSPTVSEVNTRLKAATSVRS
jgi:lipopolysaccharide transport system ATP-binding protein